MSSASSPSSPNTLISPSNWDPKSFAHWGHNEDTYDGNSCDGVVIVMMVIVVMVIIVMVIV